jgi:hypothetical protein
MDDEDNEDFNSEGVRDIFDKVENIQKVAFETND